MNSTEKDILIHKWLNDELSSSEQKLFDQLSNHDSDIDLLKGVLDQTKLYQPDIKPDKTFAWDNIEQTINKESPATKQVFRIMPFIMRVAAVALLLIGASFGWKYLNHSSDYTRIAQIDNTEIILPDGSRVWLAKGGRLSYPEKFSSKTRKVALEGEAFFDVEKSGNPFIIETPNAKVTVLGTSFGVNTDTNNTEVTVATGLVALKSNRSKKEVRIKPNYKATYDINAQKITLEKSHFLNELSWHTGEMHFENTALSNVIQALTDHFDVEIILSNKAMASCPFTSPLVKPDLEVTLNVISKAFDMELAKSDGRYLLKKGSCR